MANKETFNDHPVVNFQKLLLGDTDETHRLEGEFKTHGWCFIRLPDENDQLGKKIDQIRMDLIRFFSLAKETKSRYASPTPFGYSSIDHKEGIKVLVDQYGLGKYHQKSTDEVEGALQQLAVLMRNYTDFLQAIIFKMPTIVNSPARDTVPLSHLAMLDIVNYFNERTGPTKVPDVGFDTFEVNCVPHFDPGLFSLSILSTCDGLQLKDHLQEKWIDGPVNTQAEQRYIGVIWLGEAASLLTQNQFKPGIHRVTYPHTPHQSRLTIWQEVCTVNQIEPLLTPRTKDHRRINNNARNMNSSNRTNSRQRRVKNDDDDYYALMRNVEQDRGISLSKSGPRYVRPVAMTMNEDNGQSISPQIHGNALPEGAWVTMTNQPDSRPIQVPKGGEPVVGFMKRIEKDRGLSMSKSGVRHLRLQSPATDLKRDAHPSKHDSSKD